MYLPADLHRVIGRYGLMEQERMQNSRYRQDQTRHDQHDNERLAVELQEKRRCSRLRPIHN